MPRLTGFSNLCGVSERAINRRLLELFVGMHDNGRLFQVAMVTRLKDSNHQAVRQTLHLDRAGAKALRDSLNEVLEAPHLQ